MKPKIYPAVMFKTAKLWINTLGNKKIYIRFPFDFKTVAYVKKIPFIVYKPEGKYWLAPLNVDTIEMLLQGGFQIDSHLQKFLDNAKRRIEDLPHIEIPGLKGKLKRYQNVGVAFVELRNGCAIIADQMGCGKTAQAMGFMQLHREAVPRIIVTVAGAKINWAREITNWMTGHKIQILSGTKPYPIVGDTLIINYNIIQNWIEPLRALNPKVLILDECHKIKNDSALRTKAIKLLAKKIPYKIPMTGTLIENSPADVFNAVKIVDPNLFPSKYEFLQRYCNPEYNGFGWKYNGVSNAKELFEKLKTIMIRRLTTDVLSELQGKIYNVVPLEIDNETEYREAETDFVNYLKSGVEKDLRESLGKMIQEYNGLLELNDFKLEKLKEEKADKANPLTQMEKLKQLAVKGILEGVYEWLDDFIETGNKILVSTSHQFVIDALMLRYKKVALKIDGSVPSAKRQGIVDIFQTDKQYKILFGNIVAMAEALNITAANYVAHIEHPWNPMTKDQFEARAYRIGQTKPVFVYNFVGINTINEKIIKVLDEKRKISDAVIDGIDTPAKNLIYEVYKSYL